MAQNDLQINKKISLISVEYTIYRMQKAQQTYEQIRTQNWSHMAEYCNARVCVSLLVCMRMRSHISKPQFKLHQIFCACCLWPFLGRVVALQCIMNFRWMASCFQIMSLQHHARANAPATQCCCVLPQTTAVSKTRRVRGTEVEYVMHYCLVCGFKLRVNSLLSYKQTCLLYTYPTWQTTTQFFNNQKCMAKPSVQPARCRSIAPQQAVANQTGLPSGKRANNARSRPISLPSLWQHYLVAMAMSLDKLENKYRSIICT